MGKRIEIEKKYFCNNDKGLLKLIDKNELKLIDESIEIDEYFTDINSLFIKNRTCLRIRKKNDDYMELTFKGKSKEFLNSYAKMENNISLKKEQYNNIVDILNALGYLSYSIVDKKRTTYSKKKGNIIYNVMIDHIKSIGNFVEFELLYDDNDKSIDDLKVLLNDFVDSFKELNFESANLPYRDFVAQKNYIDILPTNDLKTIILDLNEINVDNEFITNIELLQILRKKEFKLFLTSNRNIKDIIERYELKNLFDEIIIDHKSYDKIIKNVNLCSSIVITDSKYEINNIKTVKINNDHNRSLYTFDKLSRILLLIINHIG